MAKKKQPIEELDLSDLQKQYPEYEFTGYKQGGLISATASRDGQEIRMVVESKPTIEATFLEIGNAFFLGVYLNLFEKHRRKLEEKEPK